MLHHCSRIKHHPRTSLICTISYITLKINNVLTVLLHFVSSVLTLLTMETITRQQALANGLKHYFVGKTCVLGHVAPYHVKEGCTECIKIRKALTRSVEGLRTKAARAAERERKRLARETFENAKDEAKAARRDAKRLAMQNNKPKFAVDTEELMAPLTRVAFDIVAFRPGSPRIQRELGCADDAAAHFPVRSFLDERTPYMRVYPLDAETHLRIAKKVRHAFMDHSEAKRQAERKARRRVQGLKDSAVFRDRQRALGLVTPRYDNIAQGIARAKGKRYYFNGRPCKRGHIGDRLTSTGCCLECARMRNSAAYESRTVAPSRIEDFADA